MNKNRGWLELRKQMTRRPGRSPGSGDPCRAHSAGIKNTQTPGKLRWPSKLSSRNSPYSLIASLPAVGLFAQWYETSFAFLHFFDSRNLTSDNIAYSKWGGQTQSMQSLKSEFQERSRSCQVVAGMRETGALTGYARAYHLRPRLGPSSILRQESKPQMTHPHQRPP